MLNTAASVSYTEGLANPRFINFSPNGNCLAVGNTFPVLVLQYILCKKVLIIVL